MITKDQKSSYYGFLWHGIFLALTVTFTEVNSVLPALVLQVGGSELHIGFITAIMVGFPLISQLLFAPFIQSRRTKRPYLLAGLYARMTALFGIGLLLSHATKFSPRVVLFFIYCGLTVFTLSGAFAGISYVSLIGSSIPQNLRHRFFLRKQIFWSVGVLISGILTRFVLIGFTGTQRYTFLFFLASLMLALGSIGFWMIKEPESEVPGTAVPGIKSIIASFIEILREDRTFRFYCISANLLTVSIVLIPFYLPSLLKTFDLPSYFVGTIVLLQMGGMLFSNFFWPGLVKALGFKGLLKIQSTASVVIPVLMSLLLLTEQGVWIVFLIFPLLGALSGAHKMSGEAVLVQISKEDKRALYSGIYGALNLSSALAPLAFGLVLSSGDFRLIFPLIGLISFSAVFVINKMICPVDIEKARDDMIGAS